MPLAVVLVSLICLVLLEKREIQHIINAVSPACLWRSILAAENILSDRPPSISLMHMLISHNVHSLFELNNPLHSLIRTLIAFHIVFAPSSFHHVLPVWSILAMSVVMLEIWKEETRMGDCQSYCRSGDHGSV